jgi:hypothetical protein
MFVVAGTVSGFSGDGSGITVTIHDALTDALLASVLTEKGGSFSLVWKEGRASLYAKAKQYPLAGRSEDGVAEWIETGPGRAAPGGRMGDI